MAGLLLS